MSDTPAATKRAKKPKRLSRPQKWVSAVCRARNAFTELQSALEDLGEIKSEYQDWKDNLPESLETSPVGEKLQAIEDLDWSGPLDDLETAIGEAEDMDLPRGFGKD